MNKNLNILPPLNLESLNSAKTNTGGLLSNVGQVVANTYNSAAKSINSTISSMNGDLVDPIKNSLQVSLSENGGSEGILVYMPMLITLGAIAVAVILYVTFKYQIDSTITAIIQRIREMMGLTVPTIITPEPIQESHQPPTNQAEVPVIEKILPNNKQVFNIASNIYTYADAAPLCKAMGAELATYEQVKQAWERGADWCNYGWVKGQAAVYPTQKATYDKLQQGPEDQRGACGQIGVNGGYFDNPGLRFGVNCYGDKPAESAHSLKIITEGAGQPLTPEAILFDKKVKKYAAEADTIGVLPFKPGEWSS
jgi:hypothetical protein